jgi:HD-like signal output (HDOD) protein
MPASNSPTFTASSPSVPNKARKRILLVDDETAVLELFKLMFEPMKAHWEVHVSSNPTEALALVQQQPFEVVVSDMRMPGMSGIELLNAVMQISPKTARIILSGYADQEQAAKCAGAAHQFLLKPCDLATLSSTLSRVCALEIFLHNESLQALAARMTTLPSVPIVYFRLLKELQNPNTTIETVGELVAQDPSLTAKLLQLVNSAFFGISRRLANPVEAVQVLGINTIRSLAMGIQTFSCFKQSEVQAISIDRMWKHSLATGLVAKQIAQLAHTGPPMADEAFIAGLLHDLGILMLSVNLPTQYQEATRLAKEQSIALWKAEEQVFGATHADVGAYLLGLWALPVPIVEAVALHHYPLKSIHCNFSPLTAVHVANALVRETACGTDPATHAVPLEETYLAACGVDKFIPYWRSKIAALELAAAA